MEGATESVNKKIEAMNADCLREDGMLLRTCMHGVRHPVGDIHRGYVGEMEKERGHERLTFIGAHPASRGCPCCPERCCEGWQ